ncbi:MAG: amino acid ABC transporter permease [Propionibacteriaceae bacterium]|jgi:glutamate transport system permease protein|nr:amino acid ABC transporter permease [Propionibacteriaceae bacterium]
MSAQPSLLFDAPGPKTRRRIMYGNIVGVAIVAVLLGAALYRLWDYGQLSPDMWRIIFEPVSWTAYFLPGLWNTITAAVLSIVGAMIFGLLFGVARLSVHRPLRWFASVVVEFLRAVPVLLMMIFLWTFLGQTTLPNPSFWAVVIALIAYNGSVVAELVRSGVINLPHGQHEAAMAIGLRRGQALTHVEVPQALLAMMPALVAQLVVALKDSALGQAIAYAELLRQATLLGTPLNTLQTIFVASVIFILINFGLGKLGEWSSRKMRARGIDLNDEAAEEIPINVTSSAVQNMLEPVNVSGHYDETERQLQGHLDPAELHRLDIPHGRGLELGHGHGGASKPRRGQGKPDSPPRGDRD